VLELDHVFFVVTDPERAARRPGRRVVSITKTSGVGERRIALTP
jgi:hypothetical protein